MKSLICSDLSCQRPYHAEHTGSRPITEVKQHRASSVLGWVTAWEHGVLLAHNFFYRVKMNFRCIFSRSIFCSIIYHNTYWTLLLPNAILCSLIGIEDNILNSYFYEKSTRNTANNDNSTYLAKLSHHLSRFPPEIFWIFIDPIKKKCFFRGAERTQSSSKTWLIHTLIFSH